MRDTGKSGCIILVVGLIVVFLLFISTAIFPPSGASAIQITQVSSQGQVGLLILVSIALGIIMLSINELQNDIVGRIDWFQQRTISPKHWEYLYITEGRVPIPQSNEQRKMTKVSHYSPDGGYVDRPIDDFNLFLAQTCRESWELLSVNTVTYGGGASETNWVFKRQFAPPHPPQPEKKKKGK